MTSKSKSPFLAEMGRRWIWGIAIALVGSCLGVICLAGILILVPLATESEGGMVLLIVVGALFILAILIAVPAVVILVPMMRNRKFDEYFTPLGMQGRMYALIWRQWEGMINERRVTAHVSRGPNYRMAIHTPVNTRFGIGTRTGVGMAVGGLTKLAQIELDFPELGGVAAWSIDEHWARSLLGDPSVREAFARLLSQKYGTEIRSVNISQEGIHLSIAYSRLEAFNAESVKRWLDDLLIVTEAAEALPPAAEPAG